MRNKSVASVIFAFAFPSFLLSFSPTVLSHGTFFARAPDHYVESMCQVIYVCFIDVSTLCRCIRGASKPSGGEREMRAVVPFDPSNAPLKEKKELGVAPIIILW